MSKSLSRIDERGELTATRENGTIILENCRIVFRNFAGAEGQYNREGDRNFCVLLEEDIVADLVEDGWNIKRLKPRDDEPVGTAYLPVAVGFGKGRPPKIVMITSKGRVELDEESCVLLDWADILKVDLIVRPYHWNVSGKSGVKAYLKSIFVVIMEDYLELKYSDVPEVEVRSARPIEIEAGDGLDEGDIVDGEIVED